MIRPNAIAFSKMVRCLVDGPATIREIVAECGLHYVTVQRYMQAFRKEQLVHISAWELDAFGRPNVRVYSWGQGPDRRRPKLSSRERAQRYRKRLMERQATSGFGLAAQIVEEQGIDKVRDAMLDIGVSMPDEVRFKKLCQENGISELMGSAHTPENDGALLVALTKVFQGMR